jgi:predicted dithiol-disulfide oxidoreductase (DUF899 family)
MMTDTTLMDEVGRLQQQIEADQQRLAELRRQLPAEPVSDYRFQRSDGTPVTLFQLFGEHDELIVVHNMGRGCAYCTLWADGFNGVYEHLADRVPFVVSSPDTPDVQAAFAAGRGWRFPMVSTADSSFTKDMGYWVDGEGYWPGYSVFRRDDDGQVTRVAKDFFGPGDVYCGLWHLFGLLPSGVNDWEPRLSYS